MTVKLLEGARDKSFGNDFTVYLVDNTRTSIAEAYASSDADDWKETV